MTAETPPCLIVGLTVAADTPEQALRASDVLHRAGTGLALEGMTVQVTYTTVDDEDDEVCACDPPHEHLIP